MVSTLISISEYHITEELYKGSRILVYRGYRETDSLPVVIKLLKNPYPTFSELLEFRKYTIAKNLNSLGIIQTYNLKPFQNGYILVTNREEVEHQLSEQNFKYLQEKLLLLIQRNPLPIIEWNTGLEITEWNPAAEKLFGYSKSEALSYRITELIVSKSDRPEVSKMLTQLLEQKVEGNNVTKNLTKNGKVLICEWCNSPIVDQDGQVISIVSTVQDVTKVKSFETALRENEKIYQQILDAITDMVLVKGAKSRIIWANKAFRDYYGMTEEQLQDMIDAPFNEPDHTFQYIKDDAYVFETGQTLEIPQEPVTRHDGEVRLFHTIKSAILNEQGQMVMTVGVSRDISDRQQAENELKVAEEALRQKAQDLEQTLKELQCTQSHLIQSEKMSSIGQLVAGVAHEINNPISFIYSNIEPANEYIHNLLELIELYQEHYPNTAQVIQDHIETIDLEFLMTDLPKLISSMKIGADRIKQIVLSLRNFSRMDEAEYKAVDIHSGIDSTLLILEHRLKAQHNRPAIEIIKEYGHLPLVECYPGQINQVFMNILVNALDVLEERDSKRSIEQMRQIPSTIRICTKVSAKQVVICFADNGSGIPENVLKRLFDPFFTTKPVGMGTGLGLSISYQIVVDKHQGKLTCLSTPEQGSEFQIEIPINLTSGN